MSARQRKQLQRVSDDVSSLVPELSPRIIEPSAEVQRSLGIADETLMLRVGTHRVITLSAAENGDWSIHEFDAVTGDLVPVWGETGPLDDDQLGPIILGSAIGSLTEQLSYTGDNEVHEDIRPGLEAQLEVLKVRSEALADGRLTFAPAAELEESVN